MEPTTTTAAIVAYLWKIILSFASAVTILVGVIYFNLRERIKDLEINNKETAALVKELLVELKDLKEALPKNYRNVVDYRRDIDTINSTVASVICRLEESIKAETENRKESHKDLSQKLDAISSSQQNMLILMERNRNENINR